MDGTKYTIRQLMRRRRRALPAAVIAAAGEAVLRRLRGFAPYRDARLVVAYVPSDNEIPTAPLIDDGLAAGKRVFLPRLVDRRMTFAEYTAGMVLRAGPFGIPEPTGEPYEVRDQAKVIVLLPLLAWDATGRRLGRGGGHYDRTLREAPGSATLVGLGYAFQQRAALPEDPWDVRVHYVITEQGLVCCRSGETSPVRKEDTTCDDLSVDDSDERRAGRRPGLGARLRETATE